MRSSALVLVRLDLTCSCVCVCELNATTATADNWAKWSTVASAASATTTTTNSTSSRSTNSTATVGNSTSPTPAPGTSAKSSATGTSSGLSSNVIMFVGIGVGALVVLIVIVAICKRRKRKQSMRNTHLAHANAAGKRDRAMTKTKHEEAFGGAPYNNVLDTSKGAYGSYQRKHSDPVMMEDPNRDSDTSYMTGVPTEEALSVDGMLGEAPLTPVVLGGPSNNHNHHNHNHNGGNTHHQGGKSVGNKSGFASVNDLVTQDISIRCTTSANVFDEYLRMKQEMNYDDDTMSEAMSEMSDLDSDTMSMHKLSLESSQGLTGLARGHDGGLSITDSEYDEHMRNRGASECYSEMSYNDEKYSFSEDDDMGSEFARSKPGNGGGNGGHVPDREVEI